MIVLETPRLLFRDHEESDLEPFCAMEADPEVRRFVGGPPRPRTQAELKFRSVYLPPIRDQLGLWATVFKPSRQYIGYCGVFPHFGAAGAIPGEGTLGFYLARAYWRQGIATEAGRAFVTFAFTELRLARLVATVEVGNDPSIRVLEKLGFCWHHFEKGERRAFNHFELLRHPRPPAAPESA